MTQRTRKPGKSWTHCRGIQDQFVEKILSGDKTTTIRPDAKDMKAGDRIKFFTGWRKKGALYRVTVDIIKAPEEFSLIDFATSPKKQTVPLIAGIYDENIVTPKEIAIKDGFMSFDEMVAFFKAAYPKKRAQLEWSFYGQLITFANPRIIPEKVK